MDYKDQYDLDDYPDTTAFRLFTTSWSPESLHERGPVDALPSAPVNMLLPVPAVAKRQNSNVNAMLEIQN